MMTWGVGWGTLFGGDGGLALLLQFLQRLLVLPQVDLRAHEDDGHRWAVMPQLQTKKKRRRTEDEPSGSSTRGEQDQERGKKGGS